MKKEYYVHGCYKTIPMGYVSQRFIHAETTKEVLEAVEELEKDFPIIVVLSNYEV